MMELAVVGMVLATAIAIPVAIAWLEHRKYLRMLDVLRAYAERGEEPPPPVVQALTAISGRPPDAAPAPKPRSWWLAHIAANSIFTIGFSGLAWWRFTEAGETGTLVIVCFFLALFFAASVAAQVVFAYNARR
jgi:hypothetical protein